MAEVREGVARVEVTRVEVARAVKGVEVMVGVMGAVGTVIVVMVAEARAEGMEVAGTVVEVRVAEARAEGMEVVARVARGWRW